MGNCFSAQDPKKQVKSSPKPPFIQDFTWAPQSGNGGLKVFPTAAFYKPAGITSTSALRVVPNKDYVFAAVFDGLCGTESANLCKARCYDAFAVALEQQKGETPLYDVALRRMFITLEKQLMEAAKTKPYTAGMGVVGIASVLDVKSHEVVVASVGGCYGLIGHAMGSFNQSTAEAINMVMVTLNKRPYFASLFVLAHDLPKTQAEYKLLHMVREHVLGFGIVKDPSLATAYQRSAQGQENASRGISGNAYPQPPDPKARKGGKGGSPQPAHPPGRAGWPFEEVPAPETFNGCDIQGGKRSLNQYDEHIILLSPCALSLISPVDAVGLAHAYDTPHMQLMRATVDHKAERAADKGLGTGHTNAPADKGPGTGNATTPADGGPIGSTSAAGKVEGQGDEQEQGGRQSNQSCGGERGESRGSGGTGGGQTQQQQQHMMLSNGLNAGENEGLEVAGDQEGLLGPVERKGIFNVASLLVHFMTTSLRSHTKWGDKARQVHNTLEEDEVIPEALAVAHPVPPTPAPTPRGPAANGFATNQRGQTQAPPPASPNPSAPPQKPSSNTDPSTAKDSSSHAQAHVHMHDNDHGPSAPSSPASATSAPSMLALKRKAKVPRIKAQAHDAAVLVLALEWPVSLTSHQLNRVRVLEASRNSNPTALYRWHMVRQLVKFMGRKRVALRLRWEQTVHAAVDAAAQGRRDAEVHAWKELGVAVQLAPNSKVVRNDTSVTSQLRLRHSGALDRTSVNSSTSNHPQSSVVSVSSRQGRSSVGKVQTMACQRPHQEPVLLSDKWNGPLPHSNTAPRPQITANKAHTQPSNQYAHLSASQRPGGTPKQQAKSGATAHRPISSKGGSAGPFGQASTEGSGGLSRVQNVRASADNLGGKPTTQNVGAAYDLRRRNRPTSISELHLNIEPSSPPQEVASGASSPTGSVNRSQCSGSGRLPHSNASSRHQRSSTSSKPAQSNTSSGRATNSANSRSMQSPFGSRNLQSSASSRPPANLTAKKAQEDSSTSMPSPSRSLQNSASSRPGLGQASRSSRGLQSQGSSKTTPAHSRTNSRA